MDESIEIIKTKLQMATLNSIKNKKSKNNIKIDNIKDNECKNNEKERLAEPKRNLSVSNTSKEILYIYTQKFIYLICRINMK